MWAHNGALGFYKTWGVSWENERLLASKKASEKGESYAKLMFDPTLIVGGMSH
jgi:hypothetical protein